MPNKPKHEHSDYSSLSPLANKPLTIMKKDKKHIKYKKHTIDAVHIWVDGQETRYWLDYKADKPILVFKDGRKVISVMVL